MTTAHDPLGRQPRRSSGRRYPDYADPAAEERASAAAAAFGTIWIDHSPQRAIMARLRKLHRDTLGKRHVALPGLRLCQSSQAGKTSTMLRFKQELARERADRGLPPNEHQVVIVGLDRKITLKGVYQDILIQLGDPDWESGTEKVLRQRILEFVVVLGVEMIIIDEVQHLKRDGDEARDVTDALKRLLDLGFVAMVFCGTEEAKDYFERRPQFSARLGRPLELTPLSPTRTSDARLFLDFCARFDAELVRAGAVRCSPGLTEPDVLDALLAVSGGHVGRVARLLEHAVDSAAWRDARSVERLDLSEVTRSYAMQNK